MRSICGIVSIRGRVSFTDAMPLPCGRRNGLRNLDVNVLVSLQQRPVLLAGIANAGVRVDVLQVLSGRTMVSPELTSAELTAKMSRRVNPKFDLGHPRCLEKQT